MDDPFLARLDRRLNRINQGLRDNIQAWAEILDALGWCVAINRFEEGGAHWSSTAVNELERRGLAGLTWSELKAELHGLPPGLRPVDEATMQVWAFEMVAPRAGIAAVQALTPREAEVLRWIREGKTNKEIAIILGCGHRTVEGHGLRLYRKLGITSRARVRLLGAAWEAGGDTGRGA